MITTPPPVMKLSNLHSEILLRTGGLLNSSKSILSLALTCKDIYGVLIPRVFFESVDLRTNQPNNRCCSREAIEAFVACVYTSQRNVANCVRELRLPRYCVCHQLNERSALQLYTSLGNTTALLLQLQKVQIHDAGSVAKYNPLVIRGLSSCSRLEELELTDCSIGTLQQLPALPPLRSITLGTDSKYPWMQSVAASNAVGRLLLSSRNSLMDFDLIEIMVFHWVFECRKPFNICEVQWFPSTVGRSAWEI